MKRLFVRLVIEEIVPDDKISFTKFEVLSKLLKAAEAVAKGEHQGQGWFFTQHERRDVLR